MEPSLETKVLGKPIKVFSLRLQVLRVVSATGECKKKNVKFLFACISNRSFEHFPFASPVKPTSISVSRHLITKRHAQPCSKSVSSGQWGFYSAFVFFSWPPPTFVLYSSSLGCDVPPREFSSSVSSRFKHLERRIHYRLCEQVRRCSVWYLRSQEHRL